MPGAGRLGDKALIQGAGCAHGCPLCPHPGIGPVILGSHNVNINNRPAARITDNGIHTVCCGANMWIARVGAPTVFINGKAAWRQNDMGQSCGAMIKLVEGSANVIIGDSGSAGGGGGGGQARFETREQAVARRTGAGGANSASAREGTGQPGAGAGGAARNAFASGSTPPAAPPAEDQQTKAWIEVVLTDDDGEPLAGRDYKLIMPDHSVVTGKLDARGRARHEQIEPGLVRLELPDEDRDTPPVPPPGLPDEEPDHWLDVVLIDEAGRPAANMDVELELPDGSIRDEKTDADGRLRKEGIKPGDARIYLLDVDQTPPPLPPPRPRKEEPRATLDVVLTDAEGQPAAGRMVKVELPDGTVLEEKLDAQGRLYKEDVACGEAKIHLLEEDAAPPPPVPPARPAGPEEKQAVLDVVLTDADGKPAAGMMVKVELPDGTVLEEKLDDQGRLYKPEVAAGEAKLHLLDDDGAAPPPVPPPSAAGADEAKQAWFEIQLTGDDGRPAAGLKVKLELPDGTMLDETLDADGRLRKDGVAPGDVKLHLPEEP